MTESRLKIRPVRAEDAVRLEEIRRAAFAPVFASFRSILGDEIYVAAQAREDEAAARSQKPPTITPVSSNHPFTENRSRYYGSPR